MTQVLNRLCSDCEHGYVGPDSLFCSVFRDFVSDERVAETCESFQTIPAAVIAEWVPRPDTTAAAKSRHRSNGPPLRQVIERVVQERWPRALKNIELAGEDYSELTDPAYTGMTTPDAVAEVVAAPADPKLVEACSAFLATRKCVLWGQCFEILGASGRAEAAAWLAAQITAVGFVSS